MHRKKPVANMTKEELLKNIIEALESDLALFAAAAHTAHEAATNEECQPDNKYDTTALEASYVFQLISSFLSGCK